MLSDPADHSPYQRRHAAVLTARLAELRRFLQVLSYTKMLGQLHDAGNTTTLARPVTDWLQA